MGARSAAPVAPWQYPDDRCAFERAPDWSVFRGAAGAGPGVVAPGPAPETALIVDPEPGLRVMARVILEPTLRCLEAESAWRAWELVQAEHPGVVLLEARLRDADGYRFCRQIADLPASRRPHVVFLTTERSTAALQEARLAGASAYVLKPYRPRTLYQVLRELRILHPANGHYRSGW
ncbi:MAG: response regulator [Chloroflexi bacterium]|nr:response regulator [Chloroflexota bacterium]